MMEPRQGGKLTSRTLNAVKDAGLSDDTAKLRELVRSGEILRMKGFGKARRKELMDYFGLETNGKIDRTNNSGTYSTGCR